MKISNKNIRNTLLSIILASIAILIADIVLSQVSGSLGDFFKGYSLLVIPVVLIVFYSYLGLPIFSFDGESEILHIQSHMTFNTFFGKELYVSRANLIRVEVDKSGIRKKIAVKYMKDGNEQIEKFSISLLSKSKIEQLAKSVKLIESEKKMFSGNPQLFI